jgi:outer membrane protein
MTLNKHLTITALFLLGGCSTSAFDPWGLAPSSSGSTWSPMQGNRMVCSKFCETLLPPNFEAGELSLADLIDIALQNNPQTKQTWANARASAAQYGQSLSGFFPEFDLSGNFQRYKTTFISPLQPTPYYYTQGGPSLTLSYTLFDFGQRTAAAETARQTLYYADYNHNQKIQDVLQEVMDNYYSYLYQMATLRSSEADLETSLSSLDAANEKFSLGLAALGDVAQARTQYLQSKINLTTQKLNVENAFAQLAVSLGLPANLPFKVQPMPNEIEANPMLTSVEELVIEAQKKRQDFLAANANLESQKAALLSAKRAFLPVVTTNIGTAHDWYQAGAEDHNFQWNFQLAVSIPIFKGFYYRNGIFNAEANIKIAEAELIQTELGVISDVTVAHMGVKTSAQNLKDTEDYLKAAEMEFNIALATYKAGTKTILDVLSAQSSLADARSKKAGSQKDWFTSLATIAHATGALCTPPPEETK